MSGLIAVHVGAGYHAEHKRKSYKTICKTACRVAEALLRKEKSAVEVVAEAVAVLENSQLTNAGTGSNLTLNGTVECDAGIMDGDSLRFGSVGAVYGVTNPIKVAQAILDNQRFGLLDHGRIPPCTLVGKGALQWANAHGISQIDSTSLISDSARKNHEKYIKLLNSNNGELAHDHQRPQVDEDILDTVGAVCVDMFGNVASAVSSGGLLMKHPGRLGQAAVYGAGCWAQNGEGKPKRNIAVCTTGTGEYLVRTTFAKVCYNDLLESDDSFISLPSIFRHRFLESPLLRGIEQKYGGALIVTHCAEDGTNELSWVHSTKSFILSYMSLSENKPHSIVSELLPGMVPGTSVVGSGKVL